MKNKLGVHAQVWVGGWSHEEAARAIASTASLGYDYIEAPALDPSLIDIDFTRKELEKAGLGIATMRAQIHARLAPHVSGEKLSRYLAQRGMFTYTGLSAAQADALRETHGVYLLRSGRMCVAGLNTRNVDTVAQAIARVLTND